jgi:RNA polymerase sigma-70 factor, ECF subfamily
MFPLDSGSIRALNNCPRGDSPRDMDSTPVSLLERLKVARPDDAEWDRLQQIYAPLIRRWLNRVPGLGDEAADLTQDVMVVVFKELPAFERQREGSFRVWLRNVAINRTRAFWKKRDRQPLVGRGEEADDFLARLEDPSSALSREWDQEHDRFVLRKLLDIVEPDFAPATWESFRRFALEGTPAVQVAEFLGISENAVLLAKSRILKRLREEAAGLVE